MMTAEDVIRETFAVFAGAHRAWRGVDKISDHVQTINSSDSAEYFGVLQGDLTDLAILRTLSVLESGKDRTWSIPHLVQDIVSKPQTFVPVVGEPSEAFLVAYGNPQLALFESRAERVQKLWERLSSGAEFIDAFDSMRKQRDRRIAHADRRGAQSIVTFGNFDLVLETGRKVLQLATAIYYNPNVHPDGHLAPLWEYPGLHRAISRMTGAQ